MGRPKKRRLHETWIDDSAKALDSAPLALDPLLCLDENFLVDPYLENSGQPFVNGQDLAAPDFGTYGAVSSVAGNASALWNFDTEDFDMPMGSGPSFLHTAMPDPILPPEVGLGTTTLACSCLATMYLAISSLRDLPCQVGAALAIVRAATNTAQAVLRCEQCGKSTGSPSKPVFAAFQNTMLLGTLLPTIVNCYKQLLEVVDHESSIAEIGGYSLKLDVLKNNRICGSSVVSGETENVGNALMKPEDWRTAIHQIIRHDIYGHEMISPGLKGIISEMEQRQRSRHPKMDAFGNSGPVNIFEERQCLGEKNAPCLKVLDMTKIAMESLAIS